jgi:hypothetical protein
MVAYYYVAEQSDLAARVAEVDERFDMVAVNYVEQGLQYHMAQQHLRTYVVGILWGVPGPQSERDKAPEYQELSTFVDKLKLGERLRRAKDATSINAEKELLKSDVNQWLRLRSVFLENGKIYLLWLVFSVSYATLVAFTYYATKLQGILREESLLNIIDVGLYLALVEYSGGAKSPVLLVLSLSVIAAGTEWWRVTRGKGPWALREIFDRYMPTLLYVFALLTGLVWAFLDSARAKHVGALVFVEQYGKALFSIVCLAVAIWFVFWLLRATIDGHQGGLTRRARA